MRILITAKVCPDIDAVACAEAYATYLRQKDGATTYESAYSQGVHMEANFVCEHLNIRPKIIHEASAYDKFILVDMSELVGAPEGVRPADVAEVIDHRLFNDYASMPQAKFRVEPVGAAATLIAEFFYFDRSVTLSPQLAALLLCAIYSNTVNFQADVTTFRDHRMKDWLTELTSGQFRNLPQEMFAYKSHYALEHLKETLASDAKGHCQHFSLDEPVAMFQIETMLGQETLAKKQELLQLMRELRPNERYQLLLIQDIAQAKTWLLASDQKLLERIEQTSLQPEGAQDTQLRSIPRITMRKSVLQALLTARFA